MATILIVATQTAERDRLATLFGSIGHTVLLSHDIFQALELANSTVVDLMFAEREFLEANLTHLHVWSKDAERKRVILYVKLDSFASDTEWAELNGVHHILPEECEPERALQILNQSLIEAVAVPRSVNEEISKQMGAAEMFYDGQSVQMSQVDQASRRELLDWQRDQSTLSERESGRESSDAGNISTPGMERTNRQLTQLIEFGLRLESQRDPQTILQSVCDTARDLFAARYAIAGTVDFELSHTHEFATSGLSFEQQNQYLKPDPRQHLLWSVLSKQVSYRLQVTAGNPDSVGLASTLPEVQSLLCVPITSTSRTYGWLCLMDNLECGQFTAEDERLGCIIATQAGRALENCGLYSELRKRADDLNREVAERKQAQDHFRILVEHALVGIQILQDGKYVYANAQVAKMFGYTVEEMLNLASWTEVVALKDRFTVLEQVRRRLSGAVPHAYYVFKGLRKDGTLFDVDLRSSRIELNGRPAVMGMLSDITERQQAEAGLRERADIASLNADVGIALTGGGEVNQMLDRCAAAVVKNLDAALAGIWLLDPVENVLELQARVGLELQSGSPASKIPVGHSRIGLIAESLLPFYSNDVATDTEISDPVWASREGLASFAGYPLLVEGQLVGVMAMFSRRQRADFTHRALESVAGSIALGIKRKWSERELQVAREQLEHVVRASPTVIYSLRIEGDVIAPTWVSENIRQLTGYGVSEVLTADWWRTRVHPEDLTQVALDNARSLVEGTCVSEYRFQHLDERYVWVLDSKRVIFNAEGQPVELIGSWNDITERKRLEEQLRQVQKLEAVGQLAGGVAHDFNNLLTVINGHSELLLDVLPRDDDSRNSVDQILAAGERAADLTRQLLAFSRRQLLVPVVVDINAILSRLEQMLGRVIGEDIDLQVRLSSSLGQVKVDPGQIEQVILNLAVNARDAMPRGGRLTFETANVSFNEIEEAAAVELIPGEYVMLAVSDSGCGMDASTRDRIFEPFFSTKGVEKGTGLGLSTVYGIIKQSGGRITVYSELGHGTTFKVYLPRVDDPGVVPSADPKQQARGSGTILVVEDERGVRALTKLVLQQQGYTVLEASQGAEAISISEQFEGTIDLMVSDVVMPQMSGPQLVEKIRLQRPNMKILFLSGYSDEAIVRHGFVDQNVPFLQKPFTRQILVQKVSNILSPR